MNNDNIHPEPISLEKYYKSFEDHPGRFCEYCPATSLDGCEGPCELEDLFPSPSTEEDEA